MSQEIFMWIIGILVSACSGGFIYLVTAINSLRKYIVDESSKIYKEINDKPNYKYISENYHQKEIIKLYMENIEKELCHLHDGQKDIANKLDTVLRFKEKGD